MTKNCQDDVDNDDENNYHFSNKAITNDKYNFFLHLSSDKHKYFVEFI